MNPFNHEVAWPVDGNGDLATGAGERLRVNQLEHMAFDYSKDATADMQGSLQASFAGLSWDDIHNLAASGNGTIDNAYQFVRINITNVGTVGQADSELRIAGKNK